MILNGPTHTALTEEGLLLVGKREGGGSSRHTDQDHHLMTCDYHRNKNGERSERSWCRVIEIIDLGKGFRSNRFEAGWHGTGSDHDLNFDLATATRKVL